MLAESGVTASRCARACEGARTAACGAGAACGKGAAASPGREPRIPRRPGGLPAQHRRRRSRASALHRHPGHRTTLPRPAGWSGGATSVPSLSPGSPSAQRPVSPAAAGAASSARRPQASGLSAARLPGCVSSLGPCAFQALFRDTLHAMDAPLLCGVLGPVVCKLICLIFHLWILCPFLGYIIFGRASSEVELPLYKMETLRYPLVFNGVI